MHYSDKKFLKKIESEMAFQSTYNGDLLSFDWLDEIEEACPRIDKIVRVAKVALVQEANVELIEKVRNELLDIKSGVQTTTIGIKRQLKEAQKGNSPLVINGKELKLTKKNARPQWLQERLSKYVTTGWEVIEDVPEALNHLGIILVKNKFSGQIDVIKISNVTW